MDRSQQYAILSFSIPLLIYAITLNGVFQSDYPESIIGTQWAMWKYHSFALGPPGGLIVQTVDKGLYNGQYYSAISPGFAFLSFPFAAVGFVLDGNSLNLFGSVLILDESFLAITGALAVLITYKICRLYAEPLPSFIAALTLAFGTSVWPFATMLFVHDASLLFSSAAVLLVLRYAKGQTHGPLQLAVAGVFLGVSSFVEYVAALMLIPVLAYLFLSKAGIRGVVLTVGGFLVGPILQLSYNYGVFGNPLLFPEQLKSGPSSLASQFDFLGMVAHAAYYVASPYRGVALLSPVVLLGFYGLYRMYRSGNRTDSGLFVSLFLVVLLPYSAWQDWAGGLAYGPRFLILSLPYMIIPISTLLAERQSTPRRAGFFALFAFSSFIQGTGALTTAFSVAGGPLLYQPFSLNIPWLLEGKLDSWSITRLPWADASTNQLVAAALFVSLWLAVAVLVGRLPRGSDSRKNGLETAGLRDEAG